MKNPFRLLYVFLFLILINSACFAAAVPKKFKWPNGAKAAVNLAYDDALNTQLDNAIPTLNKYHLKGSFYIPLSSETLVSRLSEWRTAATQGHELGNHTLFHQCSRSAPDREWVQTHRDLDKMNAAQMKDQVTLANAMLRAIDGKTERTFSPPCLESQAGGENYINAVKAEFVAIKFMDSGVTPDMNKLDPYAVGVNSASNATGQELINIVQEAAKKGTMANITFHGIGGDYLVVSQEAHEALLKHLAENPKIYWVDTFLNIMKYVKENKNK